MPETKDPAARLLDAALTHVPFDGWSEATFRAAVADTGLESGLARALYPRGALDMALAYHERGDKEMLRRLEEADLANMRFRDKIATAVRFRIEAAGDRELVRRGMTLFSLPQHAAEGAKAIWGTADRIWTALGDTSDDVNWYTKRATLSGVYSSVLLFWVGDDSPGHTATWAFLDRRIEDVMQFEKVKANVRENRLASALLAVPMAMLGQIRAPRNKREGMPGHTG